MNCAHCGSPSAPGQRFCGHCGRPLSVACPRCDQPNPADHRFCGNCGLELTESAATEPESRLPGPVHAERRLVSVLFVDLVGFTPFSEDRDPEEVRALLTDYFDRAKAIVERFGGVVDKFIGDAVMAVWGTVEAHDDDAERAVRAALELVDTVASIGDRIRTSLAARAGVMTGESSVGPGGNEKGLVVGDLVNTASRLQSVAEPGTVLVGEATARLVRGAVEVVDIGDHTVKGKSVPVPAWQAVRILAERGGRGRSSGLEPPFVGRRTELRLLKDMLHATGAEQRSRLVSVIGQAGIGKSRLVWEFQKYVDGLVETVYWHQGRSPAYGDGVTLWALGEMVKLRAGLSGTDDDETTRNGLETLLDRYFSEPLDRDWVGPRLATLLGLEGAAGGERNELFAAVRALFERIARAGTTVLVFEDLHWADKSLLDFVEEINEWSHQHPILVITLARPDLLDLRPAWGAGKRGWVSIHLGPLPRSEMQELVAGMAPDLPEDRVVQVVERAAGVPMFAVEFVRMLLAGDGGDDENGPDEGDLTVPDSIQAVISARLDRLPDADRELVRDAAILGHSFTLDGLATMRGEQAAGLEPRMDGLVRRELLEVVRDPRSPERGQYRWVQSLIREVAHRRISRGDRRRGHVEAARYFLGLGDPELTQVAASHYAEALAVSADEAEESELRGEALAATLAALDRVVELHAYEQIRSVADQALEFVSIDDPRRLWILEMAAVASTNLVDTDAALEYAEKLLSASAGEEKAVDRALAVYGQSLNDLYLSDRAVALLSERIGPETDLGGDAALAEAGVALARAYLLTGDTVRAAEVADRALAGAERHDVVPAVADGLITRGTALADLGRPTEALILLRGALDICRRHDLVSTGLRAQANLAYTSSNPTEALEWTLSGLEEARRAGDRGRASFLARNAIGWLTWVLRLEDAEEMLADPLYVFSDIDRFNLAGFVAAVKGDRVRARECVAAAEELTQVGTDLQTAHATRRLAHWVSIFEGDFEAAFQGSLALRRSTYLGGADNLTAAIWAAAWSGSEQQLRTVDEEIEQISRDRARAGAFRSMIEAVAAVRAGKHDEAVLIAEATASWWKGHGSGLDEVMTLATVAVHLPAAHPDRSRLAGQARDIAADSGADGLVDLLDERLGAGNGAR